MARVWVDFVISCTGAERRWPGICVHHVLSLLSNSSFPMLNSVSNHVEKCCTNDSVVFTDSQWNEQAVVTVMNGVTLWPLGGKWMAFLHSFVVQWHGRTTVNCTLVKIHNDIVWAENSECNQAYATATAPVKSSGGGVQPIACWAQAFKTYFALVKERCYKNMTQGKLHSVSNLYPASIRGYIPVPLRWTSSEGVEDSWISERHLCTKQFSDRFVLTFSQKALCLLLSIEQ